MKQFSILIYITKRLNSGEKYESRYRVSIIINNTNQKEDIMDINLYTSVLLRYIKQ